MQVVGEGTVKRSLSCWIFQIFSSAYVLHVSSGGLLYSKRHLDSHYSKEHALGNAERKALSIVLDSRYRNLMATQDI